MMSENNLTLFQRKRTRHPSECQICGSSALYSYFGAVACRPCKLFFKRNAQNGQKDLKCSFNDQCEINVNTRRVCSCCRLMKCFEKGMKVEMIRGPLTSKTKETKSILNILTTSNQSEYIPLVNLLENDNSLLDSNQWTLLSNIIHNYEAQKLFLITERIINEHETYKIITTNSQLYIQELCLFSYIVTGDSLRFNDDITHLLSDDRSILLHTAADNIYCLGGVFSTYHSKLYFDNLFWKYIERFYGEIIMRSHQWSTKLTEPDMIIGKLALALFTFSLNTRTFYRNLTEEYSNVNLILNIENKYAELTWKYLIYKYDYEQAIRIFVNIIRWFLAITHLIYDINHAQIHVNDLETIIKQTELTLLLDDVANIVQTI